MDISNPFFGVKILATQITHSLSWNDSGIVVVEIPSTFCGSFNKFQFWLSVIGGLDYWNGLLEWTTGMDFDLFFFFFFPPRANYIH